MAMSTDVLSLGNILPEMDASLIERLKTIVKPYCKTPEAADALTEDSDFIRDLQVNSANLVDIVLDIEEAFGITIDTVEMEKMLDVRSTLAIIQSKI